MFSRNSFAERASRPLLGGAGAALLAAMLLCAAAVGAQAPAGESGAVSFEGSWSATGKRQVLSMGPGRSTVIFRLSGSLFLTIPGNLSRGFWSDAVGFGNERGVRAACVWTDDRGDRIFSEIAGPGLGTGSRFLGTITGGTGRYEGLAGEYEFEWRYVVEGPEEVVQGWAVGLKGTARKAASGAGGPVP